MDVRFSASVQTGRGVFPVSYRMGIGSLPGVKRPECGADHPLPPTAQDKERVEQYLYSTLGLRVLFYSEHYFLQSQNDISRLLTLKPGCSYAEEFRNRKDLL